MKAWTSLYEHHREMRSSVGERLGQELRKRLSRLAEGGHCDPSIVGRFTQRKTGNLREWCIAGKSGGGEALVLTGLANMAHASLTVLGLSNSRTHHVHQFTAMLEGVTDSGSPWAVAVHLEDDRSAPDEDRRGSGACGHAALHCHVGPSLNAKPKVRVPLGGLGPVEALDWLLSTVVPGWEPAPWASILPALAEPQKDRA